MTLLDILGAVALAPVFIAVMSAVPEPTRQGFNAAFVAGAGAAYISGGVGPFGMWEMAFATFMSWLAYRGFSSYRFIALAWIAHASWDVAHHLADDPIIKLDPGSSAGCVIFDSLIAIWFFYGAPSLWRTIRKKTALRGPS